jgi:hypothetical protein
MLAFEQHLIFRIMTITVTFYEGELHGFLVCFMMNTSLHTKSYAAVAAKICIK